MSPLRSVWSSIMLSAVFGWAGLSPIPAHASYCGSVIRGLQSLLGQVDPATEARNREVAELRNEIVATLDLPFSPPAEKPGINVGDLEGYVLVRQKMFEAQALIDALPQDLRSHELRDIILATFREISRFRLGWSLAGDWARGYWLYGGYYRGYPGLNIMNALCEASLRIRSLNESDHRVVVQAAKKLLQKAHRITSFYDLDSLIRNFDADDWGKSIDPTVTETSR